MQAQAIQAESLVLLCDPNAPAEDDVPADLGLVGRLPFATAITPRSRGASYHRSCFHGKEKLDAESCSPRWCWLPPPRLHPSLPYAAALPHFTQPNAVWNLDVSNAPLRPNSAAMMTHLEDLATTIRGSSCVAAGSGSVCWGDTRVFNFQIDLFVLRAARGREHADCDRYPWPGTGKDPYYYVDCDDPGAQTLFPVPVGGGIEGTVAAAVTHAAPAATTATLLVSNDTTQ